MKKVIFTEAGARVINSTEVDDGSTIYIPYSVIKGLINEGIVTQKGTRRNIFIQIGNITLLGEYKNGFENTNRYCIIDSYVNGKFVGDLFKNNSISVNRETGYEKSRGTYRIRVNGEYINLATWIHHLITGEDITGKEANHLYTVWDNRIKSVSICTEEEHEAYHEKHGKESHQVICMINTIEDFKTLLKCVG